MISIQQQQKPLASQFRTNINWPYCL